MASQVRKCTASPRNKRVNRAANKGAALTMTTVCAALVSMIDRTNKSPVAPNPIADTNAAVPPSPTLERADPKPPRIISSPPSDTTMKAPRQNATDQPSVWASRISTASKLSTKTPAPTIKIPRTCCDPPSSKAKGMAGPFFIMEALATVPRGVTSMAYDSRGKDGTDQGPGILVARTHHR